ncbi:HPr family phosphocarrier protein [Sphingomonas sp. PL-96]|uniref:HPr family phosphocarrier protein n=1 Tax=Sphingomonas sp. PL-96 TaxID=2887201 RepID=UPI001E6262F7|nr:HPr family phosphocarrier protein [Sphingomonas sp. PL-96]MCC2976005.1 HPr family phosphocarrier protein [Sphingomonas sp. PL-96]
MSEVRREVRICNRRGLHARASAKFVTLASTQPISLTVEKDGTEVTATSIMGLMMLGAAMGDTIVISAKGPEADRIVGEMVALVEDRFGED